MQIEHADNIFHHFVNFIHAHPLFGGIFGAAVTFLFSLVDIPNTTLELQLIATIIKLIGITAGSTVAVASLIQYVVANWIKKKTKTKNHS